MAVYHVLRDGTRLNDITGHVVKFEDAEPLYRLLHSIQTRAVEKVSTYNTNDREVRA